MYNTDEIDDETVDEESENQSFLKSFYNTNKKLIWIALGVIILIILLSILTNRSTKQQVEEDTNLVILLTHEGEKAEKIDVAKGYAIKLKADIESLKNETFVWSSSNPDVATVESGLVKGKNIGTAIITVTYKKKDETEISESCEITVSEGNPDIEVTSINFPDGDLIMGVNSQYNLGLTISPTKGYVRERKFTSSDESIVIVDENGKVESLKTGKATITADINDGALKTSIEVYVLEKVYKNEVIIRADQVLFNGSVEKIKIGDSERLIYDVSPIDADLDTLTWKSSNEECVTVDNNGNIRGLKIGSSLISVYDIAGQEIGAVTVEVEDNIIEVNSVTLPTNLITMNLFEQQQIVPIVNPTDASNKALEYSSSDSSVVMVVPQDNGLSATLFAIKEGAVTITIKSNNGKLTYLVVNVVNSNNNNNGGNNGNNGNNGGGNTTSIGYSISSIDGANKKGWMNTVLSGAQAEGATSPITVTFTINNSATTKLKVCSYAYGNSECDANVGTTIIGSGTIKLTGKGYWVVKVVEYSGDIVRRGPDYWYAQIANGSNSGTTTGKCYCDNSAGEHCEWSSTGSVVAGYKVQTNFTEAQCRARMAQSCCVRGNDGKYYYLENAQSSSCVKDSSGNIITNKATCESKNGTNPTTAPTITATPTPPKITCFYVSGNVCKSGTYSASSCGLAGYSLYKDEEECKSHLPTATPTAPAAATIELTYSVSEFKSAFNALYGIGISPSVKTGTYNRIYVCVEKTGSWKCPNYKLLVGNKLTGSETPAYMGSYNDFTSNENFYDPWTSSSGVVGAGLGKWTYLLKIGNKYNIRCEDGQTIYFVLAKYMNSQFVEYSTLKQINVYDGKAHKVL